MLFPTHSFLSKMKEKKSLTTVYKVDLFREKKRTYVFL